MVHCRSNLARAITPGEASEDTVLCCTFNGDSSVGSSGRRLGPQLLDIRGFGAPGKAANGSIKPGLVGHKDAFSKCVRAAVSAASVQGRRS